MFFHLLIFPLGSLCELIMVPLRRGDQYYTCTIWFYKCISYSLVYLLNLLCDLMAYLHTGQCVMYVGWPIDLLFTRRLEAGKRNSIGNNHFLKEKIAIKCKSQNLITSLTSVVILVHFFQGMLMFYYHFSLSFTDLAQIQWCNKPVLPWNPRKDLLRTPISEELYPVHDQELEILPGSLWLNGFGRTC